MDMYLIEEIILLVKVLTPIGCSFLLFACLCTMVNLYNSRNDKRQQAITDMSKRHNLDFYRDLDGVLKCNEYRIEIDQRDYMIEKGQLLCDCDRDWDHVSDCLLHGIEGKHNIDLCDIVRQNHGNPSFKINGKHVFGKQWQYVK